MWWDDNRINCSSQENASKISPNLLKNLNVHAVLEPQKIPLVKNEDLIDLNSISEIEKDFLTGPEPRTFHENKYLSTTIDSPVSKNLNTAQIQNNVDDVFLSKLEQKVDISLSCGHAFKNYTQTSNNMVKMERVVTTENRSQLFMMDSKIDKKEPLNQRHSSDYHSLCEIFSNKHTNENNFNNDQNVYESVKHSSENQNLYDIIDEKHTHENNSYNYIESQAANHEDLIEEVLLTKSLDKIKLSGDVTTEIFNGIKVLSTPERRITNVSLYSKQSGDTMNSTDCSNFTRLNNDIKLKTSETNQDKDLFLSSDLKNSNIDLKQKSFMITSALQKPTKLCLPSASNYSSSQTCEGKDVETDGRKSSLTDSEWSEDSGFNSVTSKTSEYSNKTSFLKTTLNTDQLLSLKSALRSLSKERDAECNKSKDKQIILLEAPINPRSLKLVPIQTINKDPKKKCIVRSESDKLKLTKGPDLNEKIVVLPQILDRLTTEKEALIAEMNVKKRLILDSGNTQGSAKIVAPIKSVALNPVVLMEDCNKERYLAYKSRQQLGKFIQDGSLL